MTTIRLKKRNSLIFFILIFFWGIKLCFPNSSFQLKYRYHDHPDFTRVVIETVRPFPYEVISSQNQLTVIIQGDFTLPSTLKEASSKLIKSFEWEKGENVTYLRVTLKKKNFILDHFTLINPFRLVLDFKESRDSSFDSSLVPTLHGEDIKNPTEPLSSPLSKDSSKNSPARSSSSQFISRSLKTIVLDPGHGGSDRGARGPSGSTEKDITLAIAKKLKSILEKNLPLQIVLTRTEDINLPLEDRASLANNQKAEMFLSIHTNASYRKTAHGSETYFLSLHASDEDARKLAYFENNSAELEEGILPENENDIKMILWDMAQTTYLKQSSQLAELIQNELNFLLSTENRGIKQAPFKVLSNVAMPAVLIEVAFISNPREEKELSSPEFQFKVALAIYKGIAKYLRLYGAS